MRFTKVATTAAGVGAGLVAALALASPAAASPSGTVGAAASPGPYAVTTPIQPTWYIAFATARQMAATHCTSYGQNVLQQWLYDPSTGGCRDGLHADRVNRNQGAESTLSFLLALCEMRAAYQPENQPALATGVQLTT